MNKYNILVSIFQLAIGIMGVLSIIVLTINGEDMTRYIPTMLFAIALVIFGIMGIKDYRSK